MMVGKEKSKISIFFGEIVNINFFCIYNNI